MTRSTSDRRTFLAASGTALTVAVAGCLGGDDEEYDLPSDVESYLEDEDANGDWTLVDETGQDSVTIQNGVGSPNYAYDPVVVEVDAGTEVTWEWVGTDTHTVTHTGGDFDSGEQSGEGETWSYTFEDAGTYEYYCTPHRAVGQVGVVIVE